MLLVGTRKGLFRLYSPGTGTEWSIDGPHIAGYEILHTCVDANDPDTLYAAASHTIWGAHVYRSSDRGVTWSPLTAAPHHAGGRYDTPLNRIWFLAHCRDGGLWAGIDPPGLFRSIDQGLTWDACSGLNDHPGRSTWEPARGGFSVHSVYIAANNPGRIYAAVSAGGAYRSDDNGGDLGALQFRSESRESAAAIS